MFQLSVFWAYGDGAASELHRVILVQNALKRSLLEFQKQAPTFGKGARSDTFLASIPCLHLAKMSRSNVPTFRVRHESWNIAKLEHVSCPNVVDAGNQVCRVPNFWLPL